jgi:hypothetical protein
MTRHLVMALVFVSLASFVQAQPPEEPIVSYEMQFLAVGATTPTSSYGFTVAQRTCNQADPPGAANVNPTRIVWDDPDNVGQKCIHDFSSGSAIFALPIGNYVGRLFAVGATLTSGASNDAPFDVAGVAPLNPSGLRFSK